MVVSWDTFVMHSSSRVTKIDEAYRHSKNSHTERCEEDEEEGHGDDT
jgi:hypothetical protein